MDALTRSGVVPGSAEDWLLLRLERGVAVHGVDFGVDDNPHEAGLEERAVSWNKGCYLGQEVVCMQGMRGKVKRRLVSLVVQGSEPPQPGAHVVRAADGSAVGEVTASRFSVRLAKVVALARVHGAALDGAEALRVGASEARVVSRPDAGQSLPSSP
jgi:folate-binding protein YgfZ